jgi:outer membrane protein assembly factor BamB
LGSFRHIWGYGSSPVFHADAILLNCGPGKRTFVTAIDRRNGRTLWQVDEPGGDDGEDRPGEKPVWTGSWSTPAIVKVDGRDQVLVSLPHHVNAYDPADGKVLWSCDGLGELAYTSVLADGLFGVAMGGYFGPAMGFKLGGDGDVTEKGRLWLTTQPNPQRIGSGVIVGRHIFMANEPGLAQCLELETGKEVWRERLTGAKIWASLILAEGRLYVTDQAGVTYLMAPNPDKFELLGKNEIGEPTNSTLAFSGGQAFLRTFEHLVCIEEANRRDD